MIEADNTQGKASFGPEDKSQPQPTQYPPAYKFPVPIIGGNTYYPKQTVGAVRPDGTVVGPRDGDAEIPIPIVAPDPILSFLASTMMVKGWNKQQLAEALALAFQKL